MNDMKTCPFCAEDIKAAAVKCKHCGEMLEEARSTVAQPRKESASKPESASPGSDPKKLLSGLLFAVGVFLFVMALGMDTTVETSVGRVANIHLGQQQNTYLIGGGVTMVVALMLGFMASQEQEKAPQPASSSTEESPNVGVILATVFIIGAAMWAILG